MDFKPNECSWEKFRKNDDVSVCSSPEVITKMVDFLNHLGEKINIKDLGDIQTKVKIVEKLKEKTGCASESCSIQNEKFKNFASPFVVERELKKNFKTKGPSNSTAWLSNFDIDDVLGEIKKNYSDQKFWNVPFQMRDFAKTAPAPGECEQVKNMNLESFNICKRYNEGYRTFGVVINTDYSTGGGIHWFALFVDMRKDDNWTIEYFNSSGSEPLTEISAWMKKTRLLLESKFPGKSITEIIASQEEHQKDDHSCGVYSLYYIISRLSRVPYKFFQTNKIQDTSMHKYRNFLFRYDK
jgi:hypothetical protein